MKENKRIISFLLVAILLPMLLIGMLFVDTIMRLWMVQNLKKNVCTILGILLVGFAFNSISQKNMFLNDDYYRELLIAHNIIVKSVETIGGIGVDLKEYNYNSQGIISFHFTMISRLLFDKDVRKYVHTAHIVKKNIPMYDSVSLVRLTTTQAK